jgi:predicted site-specific integrase-resolvase
MIKDWIKKFRTNRNFSTLKSLEANRELLFQYYEHLSVQDLQTQYQFLNDWISQNCKDVGTNLKLHPRNFKKMLDIRFHLFLTKWFLDYHHQNR